MFAALFDWAGFSAFPGTASAADPPYPPGGGVVALFYEVPVNFRSG
ncbi:hypothetical protein [Streptomyces collinus]